MKTEAFTRIMGMMPDIGMELERSSGRIAFLMDDEELWAGSPYGTAVWLELYLNTSIGKLRELRETNFVGLKNKNRNLITRNTQDMFRLILAADRRVGWNTLSTWMFTERDPLIRKVISRRVYAKEQPLNSG